MGIWCLFGAKLVLETPRDKEKYWSPNLCSQNGNLDKGDIPSLLLGIRTAGRTDACHSCYHDEQSRLLFTTSGVMRPYSTRALHYYDRGGLNSHGASNIAQCRNGGRFPIKDIGLTLIMIAGPSETSRSRSRAHMNRFAGWCTTRFHVCSIRSAVGGLVESPPPVHPNCSGCSPLLLPHSIG